MKKITRGNVLSWCAQSVIQPGTKPVKLHPKRHVKLLGNVTRHMSVWTHDNYVKSPHPDVDIPEVSIAEYIFSKCDIYKDKEAVVDFASGRGYSYSKIKAAAIKVASGLTKQGYKKGDVVAVYSANIPEYSILMLAAASIGLIVTPANPAYTHNELAMQLEHSGATAAFTILPLLPTLRQAIDSKATLKDKIKDIYIFGEAEGCRPISDLMTDDGKAFPDVHIDSKNDVFVLPYSSGTTGLPKGVMLTHYNCIANLKQVVNSVKIEEGVDTFLGLLPFYHIYGMVPVQFGAIDCGCRLTTLPKFEPEQFLKAIQDHNLNIVHLVPPIVLFMAKHPMVSQYDLSSIKYVVSGAAPLGINLSQEFTERTNKPIFQAYGLTESSPALAVDYLPPTLGSNGPLVSNTIAKIVDLETGKNLGPGEEGEFCAKGPQVMKGYFENPQATEDMIDRDGYLHSGDIGYIDEKGNLVIEDRLKELIKYKGFQVPPAELEALLLSHPDIQDAAVIGIKDVQTGEVPKAFIVTKPNTQITEKNITDFVDERVSHYKKLRGGVEFINEIPKSASGKILRRLLK